MPHLKTQRLVRLSHQNKMFLRIRFHCPEVVPHYIYKFFTDLQNAEVVCSALVLPIVPLGISLVQVSDQRPSSLTEILRGSIQSL
jgi:hypothetical protein